MASLDTFIALRNYVKGKIDERELEDSDKLFYTVRERPNRGESEIRVEFDNEEEFLEKLGLDDDDSWFYRMVTGYYSDYEFLDYHTVKSDFESGYSGVFGPLDEENNEKLDKIAKILVPMKIDWRDETFVSEFSEKMFTNFKNETEAIIWSYVSEKNRELSVTAAEAMDKDIQNYMEDFGFRKINNGFITTVGNLIMLFIKENVIHYDLTELLVKLFEGKNLGGWFGDYWQFENQDNFDEFSYNRTVGRELDSIIEKLEELEDIEGVSTKDFLEMTDRITRKFERDMYHPLPKDTTQETRFKIDGFEFPSMKIIVSLSKGLKRRTVKLSEENFYNLLYQPTLFNLEEL